MLVRTSRHVLRMLAKWCRELATQVTPRHPSPWRRRGGRAEELEPRYVLSANFTLNASGVTLDDFTQFTNEALTMADLAGDYAFSLSEGTWNGTDMPGVIAGNGTQTLVVDKGSVSGLSGGILVDVGSITADVTLETTNFSSLSGGLEITGAGHAAVAAGHTATTTSLHVAAHTIGVSGSVQAVGGVATSVFLDAQREIFVNGGTISTGAADVTLHANQAGASTVGHTGILLSAGATVSTGGGGDLLLAGRGGNAPASGLNAGVIITGSTTVRSTAPGGGSISIIGNGGQGTDVNVGVLIVGPGPQITSHSGNILIQGAGGAGTGTSNHGVDVNGGVVVRSLGGAPATAATITIDGTAGTGAGGNHGILVRSPGTQITSLFGDIELAGSAGTASGAGSIGTALLDSAEIDSTGTGVSAASIAVRGTGNGAAPGVQIGASVHSTDGSVVVAATDDLDVLSTGVIDVSPSAVTTPSFTVELTADSDALDGGTINAAGDIVSPGGLTVALTDADGLISGTISDAGRNQGLTMTGPGTLQLTAINTYTGETSVEEGTLLVTGVVAGDVVVEEGATLGGGPPLGAGTIFGSITVQDGGTLAPGESPGLLHTGSLTLAAGSALEVEVNGPTPATDHDQLRVVGTVDLTDATLSANGTVGVLPLGSEVVLIDNDGADAVIGTFDGLADGDSIPIGGELFQILYNGGDGNDVVLVQQSALADLNVDINGSNTPIVEEGETVTLFGSFASLPRSHSVSVDWGDGETTTFPLPPGDFFFTATYAYADDAPSGTPADVYRVSVTVTDSLGVSVTNDVNFVQVRNVAPAFTSLLLMPSVLPQGATGTLSGTFVDPGSLDTFVMDIDWDGDGTYEATDLPVAGGTFSFNHVFGEGTGSRSVLARIRDDDLGEATATRQVTVTGSVLGAHLFYNNSSFDRNGHAVSTIDFAAIASDKTPLTFGGSGGFANISSYSRGINGVFIDAHLPANGAGFEANDLIFRVGNDGLADLWSLAPTPTAVGVLVDQGIGGADRIYATFADGAIVDIWLRITLRANADTGLALPRDFFFGSARGETGRNLVADRLDVDSVDLNLVGMNITPLAAAGTEPITEPADTNRDGTVNALDFAVLALNIGFDVIEYISPVPGVPGVAPRAADARDAPPAAAVEISDATRAAKDVMFGTSFRHNGASRPRLSHAEVVFTRAGEASNRIDTGGANELREPPEPLVLDLAFLDWALDLPLGATITL